MSSNDRFYISLVAIIATTVVLVVAMATFAGSRAQYRAQSTCIERGGVPIMWVHSDSMSDCRFKPEPAVVHVMDNKQ